jgi:uncharacterized OB-fold protein
MIHAVSIDAYERVLEEHMAEQVPELLTKSFELGYTYTRSTGPVIGHFLTELREGRIVGTRTTDGRVLVPAAEYDPVSAEALSEFGPVSEEGVVTTWSWVMEPISHHLLQKPFAFALIRLDGADVPMLHIVDAGNESVMKTGMRVRARWAAERRGSITDIACFEPA